MNVQRDPNRSGTMKGRDDTHLTILCAKVTSSDGQSAIAQRLEQEMLYTRTFVVAALLEVESPVGLTGRVSVWGICGT